MTTDPAKKTIIISPSGNFYGSEQVLFDFLRTTKNTYTVYVPANSIFSQKLAELDKHILKQFNPHKPAFLYGLLLHKLLLGKIKSVYVNEGGHIKYIKILSSIFRSVTFTVHIRMVYDAYVERLGSSVPSNLQLIAISAFVQKAMPVSLPSTVIYDPFVFSSQLKNEEGLNILQKEKLKLGIIGRVSKTKGFWEAASLIRYLESQSLDQYEFYFYGTVHEESAIKTEIEYISQLAKVTVHFEGFKPPKEIFDNIDAIVHFCEEEGWGRIFFEAVNWRKPLIGFKKAGLLEVASAFKLQDYLVEKDEAWIVMYLSKLEFLRSEYLAGVKQFGAAKDLYANQFSVAAYAASVETIINRK